jgi:hypothetical protein
MKKIKCIKIWKEAGVLLTVFVILSSTIIVTANDQTPQFIRACAKNTSGSQQTNLFNPPGWIHYDDGTNVDAVGLGSGGTLYWAIRITPDELVGYDGYMLTVVRWFHGWNEMPSPPHSGAIDICDADGGVITSEPFTVPSTGWFNISLSHPVVIDVTKDIWVVIHVTHAAGEWPAGAGPGPVVAGKGGWISADGTHWGQLGIDYPDMNYNWNIWAKVEEPSQPPATPQQPQGPSEGVIGVAYTFSTSTTDPEGDQVFYKWSWGDGTFSEWLGPYESGVTVTTGHTWDAVGLYNISVKAKDSLMESGWSDPKTVHIVDGPLLQVGNINGGLFKVTAVVKNLGSVTAVRISWKITFAGGVILLGKKTIGTIQSLPLGGKTTVSSGLILGLGKTVVTISAACVDSSDTAKQEAFVFLFFIR